MNVFLWLWPRMSPEHIASASYSFCAVSRMEDLNGDVFRMIVLQLDLKSLKNLALCSHKLRDFSAPFLFACCRVLTRYADVPEPPPRWIEPFVKQVPSQSPIQWVAMLTVVVFVKTLSSLRPTT